MVDIPREDWRARDLLDDLWLEPTHTLTIRQLRQGVGTGTVRRLCEAGIIERVPPGPGQTACPKAWRLTGDGQPVAEAIANERAWGRAHPSEAARRWESERNFG